jgi:nucleoside-diphosphate kinase
MIKPTAVKEHHIGGIIDMIEKANLSIGALKMQKISKEQAEAFYAEHQGKPFFAELVQMMSSGPVVLMVVEGDSAITKLREVVGSTDPKKAAPGTIRATFGKSVGENAIHASDSPQSATREIAFFFAQDSVSGS